MSNQDYGKIDFLEFLNHEDEQRKKAKGVRLQAQEELVQIEAKYQDVLEE